MIAFIWVSAHTEGKWVANYRAWAEGEGSIAMWHATTVTTHMVWPLG